MGTGYFVRKMVSISFSILQIGIIGFFGSACTGASPIALVSSPTTPKTPALETPTPMMADLPQPQPPETATPVCMDNLLFINDLTIPDGTIVLPGSSLDKQWQVQNNGNCNWDSRYRLRLIAGDALGAPTDEALYPARAGMQAEIRILFSAPQEAGEYISEWQAYNPDGVPFGQSFFIKIIVGQQ